MTHFQKNAFGWYIMVVKDERKMKLIDKILDDFEESACLVE